MNSPMSALRRGSWVSPWLGCGQGHSAWGEKSWRGRHKDACPGKAAVASWTGEGEEWMRADWRLGVGRKQREPWSGASNAAIPAQSVETAIRKCVMGKARAFSSG